MRNAVSTCSMRIRQVFLLSIALGSAVGTVAALLFALQQWNALDTAWKVKHDSRLLVSAMRLPEMLNMERAFINARLVAAKAAAPEQLAAVLKQSGFVDASIRQARQLASSPATVIALRRIEDDLQAIRRGVSVAMRQPRENRPQELDGRYLADMFKVQEAAYTLATDIQLCINAASPGIGQATRLALLAWDVRDWSGRQTTTLISYIGLKLPMAGIQAEVIAEFKGRIDQKWAAARATALQLNRPSIAQALHAVEEGYWRRGGEAYATQVVPNRGHPLALDADSFVSAIRPILDSILQLRDSGMAEALRQADANIKALRDRFILALALVLITASAAITATVWFDRRVVAPTRLITATILALASGDRDVEVPLRGRADELGQMAQAIETLRGNALLAEAVSREILLLQQARAEEKARLLTELTQSHAELSAANLTLESLAATDALTGIANRRSFDAVFAREWRRASRERTFLAILLLDVDHFKSFNDRYGHPAGDACLVRVASAIAEATRRPADLATRYGGEEFAVVLPDTDLASAIAIAETIRIAVADLDLTHAGSPFGFVTVSIGVAALIPDLSEVPETLVGYADGALYAAKRAGRNQLAAAPDVTAIRTFQPDSRSCQASAA